ncbi:hypothetical protein DSO57_1012370 [Entomophthora muscae]|uniref:Uncharacterized protein n=1 Tax=Entomophthora muscae TaxID=34485 RepID=A0ACC2TGN8_9FUNG|nr:hypothetical protein DSO57_1012370 [Entomophthora muscae]
MGNQSHKDKCLPSCATATYQPIQLMMGKEYNKHYMAAITHNPPTPTAATPLTFQHHPPNPSPPRPALPLRLPCCAILPPRHHSSLPIRIVNFSSLETRAQEQESNPNSGPLDPWATRPVDRSTACLRLSGIKPPQADTKNVSPCSETSQTKEIIALNGRLTTAHNEGTDLETISFMNLKSTPAIYQEPTQERGTGPRPGPMTIALKQDNQVAKLKFLTNERTPGPSGILLPLDQAPSSPCPAFPNFLMNPPIENVKFGGGVLYRPKDPALQTYCHF